jgi:hypothetical protein
MALVQFVFTPLTIGEPFVTDIVPALVTGVGDPVNCCELPYLMRSVASWRAAA